MGQGKDPRRGPFLTLILAVLTRTRRVSMRHSSQLGHPLWARKFCHLFGKQIKCKKCVYSLSCHNIDGAGAVQLISLAD